MLSIIGGKQYGLLKRVEERSDRLQLKMVKVNRPVSSFFSGIQAIITELELRTARNERVGTWTLIGTNLIIRPNQLGRMLRVEAAVLFKTLIDYQTVVVVSTGHMGSASEPLDVFPANFAKYRSLSIIVAASALCWDHNYIPGTPKPFIVLNAPQQAECKTFDHDSEVEGDASAVALVTALAADMLTRPKVRAKLSIDDPSATLRTVSAKIRDYLDSLSFNHYWGRATVKCVWNGLDPELTGTDWYNP